MLPGSPGSSTAPPRKTRTASCQQSELEAQAGGGPTTVARRVSIDECIHALCTSFVLYRACVRHCWPARQPNKVNCPRLNTGHKYATAGHGSAGHGSAGHGSVDAPCASVWGGLHWQPPAWTLNASHIRFRKRMCDGTLCGSALVESDL
jgi:hypothetical protein